MNLPKINKVKNRFLPIPEAVLKNLEPEPKISDFEILKELGAGSFGRVYLVTHKQTKAQYAIKAIDKRNKTNIKEKPYFRREIEIMYKIHHPNVVRLYSHFEDDNYCYFIMEYVQKGNIYSLISKDKSKRLNTQLIAQLMLNVISAVYFLHKMNPPIIHRDIKPENVLLGEGNLAKLTDFGWSNYMQEDEKRTTVCGTPIYLAPEIINESGHDEKVDIWCIGILLFELSSGDIPFLGNDIETLKHNIRQMKISWPRDFNPEIKNLISKILKYDPKERISINDILKHSFFTKHFENINQYLITPNEQIQYKPFVVSVDNPKDPPVVINAKIEKYVKKVRRDISPNPVIRPRIEKISHDNNNYLKNKYKELNCELQLLINNQGNNNINNSNCSQKEVDELIQQNMLLRKELNYIKKELQEKENKIQNLNNKSLNNESKEKIFKLENENVILKSKIEKYENELIHKHNIININKLIEELSSLSKGREDIKQLINEIQNDLNDNSTQQFINIFKEKEKELERQINLKESDKEKYVKKLQLGVKKGYFDKVDIIELLKLYYAEI